MQLNLYCKALRRSAYQMHPNSVSMHYAKLLFNLYLQLMEINYYYYSHLVGVILLSDNILTGQKNMSTRKSHSRRKQENRRFRVFLEWKPYSFFFWHFLCFHSSTFVKSFHLIKYILIGLKENKYTILLEHTLCKL